MVAGRGEGERSDLVKLAARLIVEERWKARVGDRLGCDYYAHGARARHRSGYRQDRLKTAEEAIE